MDDQLTQKIKDILRDMAQGLLQFDKTTAPNDLDGLLERFAKQIAGEQVKPGRLLREKEVATLYPPLNVNRLRNWRARDVGPPYIKFGEARQSPVFYREESLNQWIMNNERLSEQS